MGRYSIAALARLYIDEIFDFGVAALGEYRATAYHAGLERTFGLLADFPRMAPLTQGLKRPFRRFRFQAHFIYYSEESGFIAIRAILHHAQDWRRAPP